MRSEMVIVPTYLREELLFCCLKRIRESQPNMPIVVFPDRGTYFDRNIQAMCATFQAAVYLVPDTNYYGNTSNTMNALLWGYNSGFERVYYIESDVMVHPDFFDWHRQQHDNFDDIFASMAWIFNRQAPITDDLLFQPWYYAIGTCFTRRKLELIARHATPKYYEDMSGYIEREFTDSHLNAEFAIEHYEQDGLIQRILDRDKSQTVTPGIAKCSHMGFIRSYGHPQTKEHYDMFLDSNKLNFADRVRRVEQFIADPYWRMSIFGREIVEREVGYALPKRERNFKITIPGGWESEFHSELNLQQILPSKINSVRIPEGAEIMVQS